MALEASQIQGIIDKVDDEGVSFDVIQQLAKDGKYDICVSGIKPSSKVVSTMELRSDEQSHEYARENTFFIYPFIKINDKEIKPAWIDKFILNYTDVIPTVTIEFIDMNRNFTSSNELENLGIIKIYIGGLVDTSPNRDKSHTYYKPIRQDFLISNVENTEKGVRTNYGLGNKIKITGELHLNVQVGSGDTESGVLDAIRSVASDMGLGYATNIQPEVASKIGLNKGESEGSEPLTIPDDGKKSHEIIKELTNNMFAGKNTVFTTFIDPYYYVNTVEVHELLFPYGNIYSEKTIDDYIKAKKKAYEAAYGKQKGNDKLLQNWPCCTNRKQIVYKTVVDLDNTNKSREDEQYTYDIKTCDYMLTNHVRYNGWSNFITDYRIVNDNANIYDEGYTLQVYATSGEGEEQKDTPVFTTYAVNNLKMDESYKFSFPDDLTDEQRRADYFNQFLPIRSNLPNKGDFEFDDEIGQVVQKDNIKKVDISEYCEEENEHVNYAIGKELNDFQLGIIKNNGLVCRCQSYNPALSLYTRIWVDIWERNSFGAMSMEFEKYVNEKIEELKKEYGDKIENQDETKLRAEFYSEFNEMWVKRDKQEDIEHTGMLNNKLSGWYVITGLKHVFDKQLQCLVTMVYLSRIDTRVNTLAEYDRTIKRINEFSDTYSQLKSLEEEAQAALTVVDLSDPEITGNWLQNACAFCDRIFEGIFKTADDDSKSIAWRVHNAVAGAGTTESTLIRIWSKTMKDSSTCKTLGPDCGEYANWIKAEEEYLLNYGTSIYYAVVDDCDDFDSILNSIMASVTVEQLNLLRHYAIMDYVINALINDNKYVFDKGDVDITSDDDEEAIYRKMGQMWTKFKEQFGDPGDLGATPSKLFGEETEEPYKTIANNVKTYFPSELFSKSLKKKHLENMKGDNQFISLYENITKSNNKETLTDLEACLASFTGGKKTKESLQHFGDVIMRCDNVKALKYKTNITTYSDFDLSTYKEQMKNAINYNLEFEANGEDAANKKYPTVKTNMYIMKLAYEPGEYTVETNAACPDIFTDDTYYASKNKKYKMGIMKQAPGITTWTWKKGHYAPNIYVDRDWCNYYLKKDTYTSFLTNFIDATLNDYNRDIAKDFGFNDKDTKVAFASAAGMWILQDDVLSKNKTSVVSDSGDTIKYDENNSNAYIIYRMNATCTSNISWFYNMFNDTYVFDGHTTQYFGHYSRLKQLMNNYKDMIDINNTFYNYGGRGVIEKRKSFALLFYSVYSTAKNEGWWRATGALKEFNNLLKMWAAHFTSDDDKSVISGIVKEFQNAGFGSAVINPYGS